MSETDNARMTAPVDDGVDGTGRVEPTAWAGWVVFAGVMLLVLGGFEEMMGFVALFDPGYFLVTRHGLVVSVDYTTWGWVHLAVGVIGFLTGIGVLAGQTWARVVGIILAVLSAVANLGFLAAYPLWTTILIAVDIIVIYALAVHGDEVRGYDD